MDRLVRICLGLLLATVLFALVAAWPVMIGLGILHTYWSGVPNFGFLATLVLLWAADILIVGILGTD